MNKSNQQPDEKHLWRQFAKQDRPQPVLSDLDPNIIAAYLDGHAKPAQVEQIEALMASNPSVLDELIELSQLKDASPALASQALLERAKALVPAAAEGVSSRSLFRYRFQWAAVAAAVLLACLGGYGIGQTTFQHRVTAQAYISSQVSLDFDDLLSDPALAVLFPTNGTNGGQQ